jgi:hypothetical protein
MAGNVLSLSDEGEEYGWRFPHDLAQGLAHHASIQTGVVLLILVVIFAAVGTIVLQRPVTEPDEMQNAYSPQALRSWTRSD